MPRGNEPLLGPSRPAWVGEEPEGSQHVVQAQQHQQQPLRHNPHACRVWQAISAEFCAPAAPQQQRPPVIWKPGQLLTRSARRAPLPPAALPKPPGPGAASNRGDCIIAAAPELRHLNLMCAADVELRSRQLLLLRCSPCPQAAGCAPPGRRKPLPPACSQVLRCCGNRLWGCPSQPAAEQQQPPAVKAHHLPVQELGDGDAWEAKGKTCRRAQQKGWNLQ